MERPRRVVPGRSTLFVTVSGAMLLLWSASWARPTPSGQAEPAKRGLLVPAWVRAGFLVRGLTTWQSVRGAEGPGGMERLLALTRLGRCREAMASLRRRLKDPGASLRGLDFWAALGAAWHCGRLDLGFQVVVRSKGRVAGRGTTRAVLAALEMAAGDYDAAWRDFRRAARIGGGQGRYFSLWAAEANLAAGRLEWAWPMLARFARGRRRWTAERWLPMRVVLALAAAVAGSGQWRRLLAPLCQPEKARKALSELWGLGRRCGDRVLYHLLLAEACGCSHGGLKVPARLRRSCPLAKGIEGLEGLAGGRVGSGVCRWLTLEGAP